jgi:FemAB-related protein (PEP-CTERM system-associated)
VTVGLLEGREEQEWASYAASHPDATIYHSLGWRDVTVEGLGHAAYLLRARAASGAICGILPLYFVKGIYGRRLVSVPMRDRAGVLSNDDDTAVALIRRGAELSAELRCQYLELKQLRRLPATVTRHLDLQEVEHWVTTRIDLSIGRDKIWSLLDRDAVRWAIRKAEKSGVRMELDNSVAGIDRFYDIFSSARTRMGIPPFPRSLFRAIGRHILDQGKGCLHFAMVGDRPVNGMISFYSGDTFLPAYAAPQRHVDKRYYPSEVMFWHTIEWASQNGFAVYDFGADSPHQEGLLRFKRKWGGVPLGVATYFHTAGRLRLPKMDSSDAKYALARRIWSRLPLGASRALGAWVTRQLS